MTSEVVASRHPPKTLLPSNRSQPGGHHDHHPKRHCHNDSPIQPGILRGVLGGAEHVAQQDIVGYWPGDSEPGRGLAAYTQKIADILAAAPDLTLELIDSATAAGAQAGAEPFFLHHVGRANGPDGPIEIRGLDRVRTRDGIVVEKVIRYDPRLV